MTKNGNAHLIAVKEGYCDLDADITADKTFEVHCAVPARFSALRQSGLSAIFYWRQSGEVAVDETETADCIGWKLREGSDKVVIVHKLANCPIAAMKIYFKPMSAAKFNGVRRALPKNSHQNGKVSDGHRSILRMALNTNWTPPVEELKTQSDTEITVDDWAGYKPNSTRSVVEDALGWIAARGCAAVTPPPDVDRELARALAFGYIVDDHFKQRAPDIRAAALSEPKPRRVVILYSGEEDGMTAFLKGLFLSHRFMKSETDHLSSTPHKQFGLDDLVTEAHSELEERIAFVACSEDALTAITGLPGNLILLRTNAATKTEVETLSQPSTEIEPHKWSDYETIIGEDGVFSKKFAAIGAFFDRDAGERKES